MKFRTGLIVGLGTGYVLGAKAGRERYEQIAAAWARLRGIEDSDAAADRGAPPAEMPPSRTRRALGSGLRSASAVIRDRVNAPRR